MQAIFCTVCRVPEYNAIFQVFNSLLNSIYSQPKLSPSTIATCAFKEIQKRCEHLFQQSDALFFFFRGLLAT